MYHKHQSFIYKQLNAKIVLSKTIQFSINTQFSSLWHIHSTLSGAIAPRQNTRGSDGSEGVFCIPQSSCITEALPSYCLVSYPGNYLGESYPSSEMQPLYSTAPVDWATSPWEPFLAHQLKLVSPSLSGFMTFCSLARSKYLSLFSLSSPRTAKFTIRWIVLYFLFCFFFKLSLRLVFWSGLGNFYLKISKNCLYLKIL